MRIAGVARSMRVMLVAVLVVLGRFGGCTAGFGVGALVGGELVVYPESSRYFPMQMTGLHVAAFF